MRCGSLPVFSRKGGGYRTARVERSARKAGANASTREPLEKGSLRSRRARIGRSRSCSRVISCCCRSRQTVAGAEKRTHLHFTRSGSVQGRAPSSQLQRTRVRGRERRNTGTLIEAETHVTVLESGCDPRMAREAGDGRHPGSSWWAALHGTLANTVSAAPAILASRKRSQGTGEATGVSEVRWTRECADENAAQPTWSRPPKRIRRREPPGPPVSSVQGASPGRWGEAQASKRCWERMWRECS